MRLLDIVVLSIVLCVFSPIYSGCLKNIRKMDSEIEFIKMKNDSLNFISKSFFNTCSQNGFKDFYEWAECCKKMWSLENIEWNVEGKGKSEGPEDSEGIVGTEGTENSVGTEVRPLFYASWSGPYGNGKIYYRTKGESYEQNK